MWISPDWVPARRWVDDRDRARVVIGDLDMSCGQKVCMINELTLSI